MFSDFITFITELPAQLLHTGTFLPDSFETGAAHLNTISNYIDGIDTSYKIIATTVSLIIALLGCFFGYKLSKLFMSLTGLLVGAVAGGMIGASFLDGSPCLPHLSGRHLSSVFWTGFHGRRIRPSIHRRHSVLPVRGSRIHRRLPGAPLHPAGDHHHLSRCMRFLRSRMSDRTGTVHEHGSSVLLSAAADSLHHRFRRTGTVSDHIGRKTQPLGIPTDSCGNHQMAFVIHPINLHVPTARSFRPQGSLAHQ